MSITVPVEGSPPPTFESVWAALQELTASQKETARLFKDVSANQRETALLFKDVSANRKEIEQNLKDISASQKETEQNLKELSASQKETERIIKESQKETDRIMKEGKKDFNIRLGALTNLFGDFTVGMVAPKLREKFMDFKLVFLKSSPNVIFDDKTNNLSFEIDILLENGEKAMLVEVKTKLTNERINKHIERLEKMRKYADLHGDKRTFVGAVAGIAVTEEVKKITLSQGLYLIEPDGENFNITPPNDSPREW